jgi:hypothetical protein
MFDIQLENRRAAARRLRSTTALPSLLFVLLGLASAQGGALTP